MALDCTMFSERRPPVMKGLVSVTGDEDALKVQRETDRERQTERGREGTEIHATIAE